jgi:hypothetical protein
MLSDDVRTVADGLFELFENNKFDMPDNLIIALGYATGVLYQASDRLKAEDL